MKNQLKTSMLVLVMVLAMFTAIQIRMVGAVTATTTRTFTSQGYDGYVQRTTYLVESLYENYVTGDDFDDSILGVIWRAQTFTVNATWHTVTSVNLKLCRWGSPGNVTVGIRATSGNHPSGSDLTNGTTDGNTLTDDTDGEWRKITLTEYTLSASTKYAIVVRLPSGDMDNFIGWRYDSSSPTYADGNYEVSSNSGATWTSGTNYDFVFEVWGNNCAYEDTRTSNVATTAYSNLANIGVGQYHAGSTYLIDRSFLYFDTSMIPDSATVTNAILGLDIQDNVSDTDFNVTIQHSTSHPEAPFTLYDYNYLYYSGDGGSRNTTEITALNYWNVTLSITGLSWIDVDDTTKLCLRSSNDIDGTAPTGNEYIFFYSAEKGEAYAPKLYVTYEVEGSQLEVQSLPTDVAFTLNGTSESTPYTGALENATYVINFTSSFVRSGLTWSFAYWNDNTSNTDPIRTIDLQSNSSYSVTYTSSYAPLTYTGYEPVFECAMNNMFELDAISESMIGNVQRQMLLDSSPYANHGCLYPITAPYGGPSMTWGYMGKALEFDGVDDSVIVGNSVSLNVSEALTIEFWFRVYNVTTNQTLFSKYSSGAGQWLVGISDGQIYSKLWTTSGTEYGAAMTTYNISSGVFYFFTLTYDFRDGYYSMWLHGAPQQNVTTDAYPIRNVDVAMYLGSLGNSSSWFNGVLDEVRIYPYERTEGEVYNDARNAITKFGSWNFVASIKQAGFGTEEIATEGVIDGYTGLKTNDWQLPWAYANDTYRHTAIRSASYAAGFQSYQLYCNVKFQFYLTGTTWARGYADWYWLFFRDGKLQVAYIMEISPDTIIGATANVTKWHVRFVRSTSYSTNVTMLDYIFSTNTTLYPNSIPIIVSAWIGPDNSHFTIRFDVQDSRMITAYDGSYVTPFAYSFELVDENANPHLLTWFDGWVVSGIKIRVNSVGSGTWSRMEIESHKFSWLAVAFIFFPVIVGGWIAYQAITSGKNPVTTIIEYSTEITTTLLSLPEIVGTAVKTAGEPVRDAIAGLSHDIIAAVSGLGNTLTQTLGPALNFGWLPAAIANAFVSIGVLVWQAILAGWGLYVGTVDALFAYLGSPFTFTTFVGWINNAAGWVSASLLYSVTLFTSFFSFLGGWLTGFLEIVVAAFNWWAMEITMISNFLTGSYGVGVNFWTEYNLTQWIGLVLICYPIFLVFMWEEKGLDAVIEHITFMYNSFHFIAYILLTIVHYVSSMITRLLELIPVAE